MEKYQHYIDVRGEVFIVCRNDVRKSPCELNDFEFQQQQNLGRIFGSSKMHYDPSGFCCCPFGSNAVVLFLFIRC